MLHDMSVSEKDRYEIVSTIQFHFCNLQMYKKVFIGKKKLKERTLNWTVIMPVLSLWVILVAYREYNQSYYSILVW